MIRITDDPNWEYWHLVEAPNFTVLHTLQFSQVADHLGSMNATGNQKLKKLKKLK